MLLKLWKSILGKKPSETATKRQSTRSQPASPGQKRKLAKPTSPGRGILGRGPHAALCRQIKQIQARSVLEIGIGDGSRAAAVLQALQKSQPEAEIHYSAIDQFEMAGGPVTLKQFHQQIRGLGIKPNLIPMPIEQGLARIAHTIGSVDLILLQQADLEIARPMLSRITAAGGAILVGDGQCWQPFQVDTPSSRQAA